MRTLRAFLAAPLLFVPLLALAVGRALLTLDFDLVLGACDVDGDLLKP